MIQPVEKAAAYSGIPAASTPKRASSEHTPGKEQTTVNTDDVDREIRQLKVQKQKLESRLQSEQDEQKKNELRDELKSIESMLSFKDNDAYRKDHAIVV